MEQTCPNCDRHCPISALHCGRGREYFGIAETADTGNREHSHHDHGRRHERSDSMRDDSPRAVQLLRECGHLLHHGRATGQELIAPLTARELQTLERLLEKCLYEEK